MSHTSVCMQQLGKSSESLDAATRYYEKLKDGTMNTGEVEHPKSRLEGLPNASFVGTMRFHMAPFQLTFADVEPLNPTSLFGNIGKPKFLKMYVDGLVRDSVYLTFDDNALHGSGCVAVVLPVICGGEFKDRFA